MFLSNITTITRVVENHTFNGVEVRVRQQYKWVSEVGGEVEPLGPRFIRLSDGAGNVWHLFLSPEAEETLDDQRVGTFYDFDAGKGESRFLSLGEYIEGRIRQGRRIYNT